MVPRLVPVGHLFLSSLMQRIKFPDTFCYLLVRYDLVFCTQRLNYAAVDIADAFQIVINETVRSESQFEEHKRHIMRLQ